MPAKATELDASPGKPDTKAGLTELLDHVAAELAAEYVRLMEAAAEREQPPSSPPEGEPG